MALLRRYLYASSLSLSLVGCALDTGTSTTSTHGRTEATQQAVVGYTDWVEQSTQAIVFAPQAPVDWVDLHLTINGEVNVNVRMQQDGSSYRVGPLPLVAGDTLEYSFTYFAEGVGHDSPSVQHTLPSTWESNALSTEVAGQDGAYEIRLLSSAEIAWADVHYTINNRPQQNVRLQSGEGALTHQVALESGDTLRYWVTYATGSFVFDTAEKVYNASPVETTRFIVNQPLDSSSGTCVANQNTGSQCNLRAALGAALNAEGPVSIQLNVDSTIDQGQILLSLPSGTDSLELDIEGNEHHITGNGTSKLFVVSDSVSLKLSALTVSGFFAMDSGGALVNYGELELRDVTLSDNTTGCFGTGAMTAFATCNGGAIANFGTLTIGDTHFEHNEASAYASTASFTNASASGGAIVSSGSVIIDGPVSFVDNAAVATATSGIHPGPGGASANSSAGAVLNLNGTFVVTGDAVGSCLFQNNAAEASASAPAPYPADAHSRGGAIHSEGGQLEIPAGACSFVGNTADEAADVYVAP